MRRTASIVLAVVIAGSATAAAATHLFPDVADTHTHADSIEWAFVNEVVVGRADGTFGPGEAVTRGQLATMLEKTHELGRRPHYLLTPVCGSTEMQVVDIGSRGSGSATVEFSVDGGEREVTDAIPADGFMTFDPETTGIVSLFVDGLAWAHAPTAQDCTAP